AVGLAVLAVVPRNPGKILPRAAAPLFTELAAVLDEVAAALEARALDRAAQTLTRARGLDDLAAGLRETVGLSAETVRIAPLRRHERGRVERYATAVPHVGFAIRNTRVLARAAVRAIELEPSIPVRLVESIRTCATAVRRLEPALDEGTGEGAVREAARRAAREATASYAEEMGFAIGVLVGQVRSIAADLLRVLGLERREAIEQLRAAVEPTPE